MHKHGACSPLRSGKAVKLDRADILRRDQARVDSIHSKLSNNLEDRLTQTGLPVKDESKSKEDLGSGSYIVTIGIGTPTHNQPLIIDTGSDLTWTKCRARQCRFGRYRSSNCNSENNDIFNPSLSTSFNTVSSTSRVCSGYIISTGSIFFVIFCVMFNRVLNIIPSIRYSLFGDSLLLQH